MEEQKEETTSPLFLKCPECDKRAAKSWDWIDRKIFHDNGHVWPGFAGEPDGGNYGGSDF